VVIEYTFYLRSHIREERLFTSPVSVQMSAGISAAPTGLFLMGSYIIILGKFTKNCLGSPDLVDIWYDGLSSCYIVDSDIFSTIQKTHFCTSLVRLLTFITLLTATYVRQYYKYNALLPLRGNTGYTLSRCTLHCLPCFS
jgi:hypothetical protein